MFNNKIYFDPTETFASKVAMQRQGLDLGMKMSGRHGDYLLCEANEALSKGNILINSYRCSFDAVTYTAASKMFTVSDAGATFDEGELAGSILVVDDATTNGGQTAIVKSNSAGTSGNAMYIYLETAISTPTGADIDIEVWDACHVVKAVATVLLQKVVGVAPVAVTSGYFFWMQINGLAAVIDGTATPAAVNRILTAGDGTAGQALELTTTAGDDALPFALVMVPAEADGALAIVNLL